MNHMFIMASSDVLGLRSSTMHLVLPHLYDDEDYVRAYRELKKSGDFIMQDNSMFELKETVSGDLLEFADYIGADEVVVPEVWQDAKGCLEKTEEFFEKVGTKVYPYRFAACIQGKSYAEVSDHYSKLMRWGDRISTICIPFGLDFDAYDDHDPMKKEIGWNRFSVVRRLVQEGIWKRHKTHHLLGCNNPAEFAAYYKSLLRPIWASLRSSDSKICYQYAQFGVVLDEDMGLSYRKIRAPLDFTSKLYQSKQTHFFFENREIMKRLCAGTGGSGLYLKYQVYAHEVGMDL